MSDTTAAIPADDLKRHLAVAKPNTDASLRHISMMGDTYTVLLSGEDTAGRFCLIDMYVPAGGGPPPHRHDFEETFSILEGEIEVTFRGEKVTAKAGETVNVPANAPHSFRNASQKPARMLCLCSPAGIDEYFASVGDPVEGRTSPPPQLNDAAKAARMAKAVELAPRYRTEILHP